MKLFCLCTIEWVIDFEPKSNRQIQANYTKDAAKSDKNQQYCLECGYWKWYDADYENMMFDLRSMNS